MQQGKNNIDIGNILIWYPCLLAWQRWFNFLGISQLTFCQFFFWFVTFLIQHIHIKHKISLNLELTLISVVRWALIGQESERTHTLSGTSIKYCNQTFLGLSELANKGGTLKYIWAWKSGFINSACICVISSGEFVPGMNVPITRWSRFWASLKKI